MIAPSGGFSPYGSSGGSGVSGYVERRKRYAAAGLNSRWLVSALFAVICRSVEIRRESRTIDRAWRGRRPRKSEIPHRGRGQVELQRRPVIAVVERDPHTRLGAGKEQPFANGIFAHRVDGRVVRQAGGDQLPSLTAIVRAVDVRLQVVDAEAAHRRKRIHHRNATQRFGLLCSRALAPEE